MPKSNNSNYGIKNYKTLIYSNYKLMQSNFWQWIQKY